MKTHFAYIDKANESDPVGYIGTTLCGLEYTESPVSDRVGDITCKKCLKRIVIKSKEAKKMSGLEIKYFTLKPKGNDPYAKASRKAMRAYALGIESENPELAEDLRQWADRETFNAEKEGK